MVLESQGAGRTPFATIGVASALILAPMRSRKGILFINDSSNLIYLSRVDPAVIGSGIRLNPNGGWYEEPNNRFMVWTGPWYAIATVAGSNLCINEDW